jgi:hypothetical protein
MADRMREMNSQGVPVMTRPERDRSRHPEATRTARGLAGDSTQAMSWFSVEGNAGIALDPVIVTPILRATRLHGTPLLARFAIRHFIPRPRFGHRVVRAVRRPGHAGPGLPADPRVAQPGRDSLAEL